MASVPASEADIRAAVGKIHGDPGPRVGAPERE
jgi:hypothetical protein